MDEDDDGTGLIRSVRVFQTAEEEENKRAGLNSLHETPCFVALAVLARLPAPNTIVATVNFSGRACLSRIEHPRFDEATKESRFERAGVELALLLTLKKDDLTHPGSSDRVHDRR